MTSPRTPSRPSRRRLGAFGILAIVLVVAACSSGGATLSTVGRAVPDAAAPVAGGNGDTSGNGGGGGAGSGSGSAPDAGKQPPLNDVNRPDLLIIKTGDLSLEVTGIDDALAAASVKIAGLGGYVSGSQRKGADADAVATVVYRIPSARWDEALVALRGLGTKVLGESSQSQDVTGDVLDLGARITNLQATERALQAVIEKATKISDILAVQTELTKVRGEIEQLSTQKAHLEGQASFSTLTVSYALKQSAAVIVSQNRFDPASEVDRASASLVDVLQGVATAGIWFGIVWLPILFFLAIVAGAIFVVARRFRPSAPVASAIES